MLKLGVYMNVVGNLFVLQEAGDDKHGPLDLIALDEVTEDEESMYYLPGEPEEFKMVLSGMEYLGPL